MKGKETAIDAYMAIVLREAACKKETVISDWKNIKKNQHSPIDSAKQKNYNIGVKEIRDDSTQNQNPPFPLLEKHSSFIKERTMIRK